MNARQKQISTLILFSLMHIVSPHYAVGALTKYTKTIMPQLSSNLKKPIWNKSNLSSTRSLYSYSQAKPLHCRFNNRFKNRIVPTNVSYVTRNLLHTKTNDQIQYNALREAIQKGNKKEVEILLRVGIKLDTVNEHGSTLLHCATLEGDVDIVKQLLDAGAPIDTQDNYSWTALHVAAENGCIPIVNLLIKWKADKSIKIENSFTPPRAEVHMNQEDKEDEVKCLLKSDHYNKDVIDKRDWTPLFLAAHKGYKAIVDALMKAGADKNLTDTQGRTPLHLAVHGDHTAIAQQLIAAGASKIAPDKEGSTPLHLAASKDNGIIVTILLESDPDKNAQNNKGLTPLHLAAREGHVGVVKQLIKKTDTYKDTIDQNGFTALYLAAEKGHAEVVEILTNDGAATSSGRCC